MNLFSRRNDSSKGALFCCAFTLLSGMYAFAIPAEAATTVSVVNTDDAGTGSLREAINFANANPGTSVKFNIAGSGAKTIQLATALPNVSATGTVIDASTQPGYGGTPLVVLDGTGISGASGLTLDGANCTVRGLAIQSFSQAGIRLTGLNAKGNVIQGCILGFGTAGQNVPNSYGIDVYQGPQNNVIGGTSAYERNIISGNTYQGIRFSSLSGQYPMSGNVIQGNYVGVDVTGTVAVPNGSEGIQIKGTSNNNLIGGTALGAGNLVSGNGGGGIYILSGPGNTVQGNLVGTDVTGTKAIPNYWSGIFVNSKDNIVGGTTAGARNVSSGNRSQGIYIQFAKHIVVQGNYVGTDITGTKPLPNGGGIRVDTDTSNVVIGGTEPGATNRIAYNEWESILVFGSRTAGNSIRANEIFDNEAIGIDLFGSDGKSGITPNDDGDADTGSANNLQNYPLLTSVKRQGTSLVIGGNLNSTSNRDFALDFFRSVSAGKVGSGEGQAQFYLGTGSVKTDATGNGTFEITLPESASGTYFTATATDLTTGDTSELSRPLTVTIANPILSIGGTQVAEGDSGITDANFKVTLSPASLDTVKVSWSTGSRTATPEEDYTASNGTLTFKPGETSKVITVSINGDNKIEEDETFVVRLFSSSGADIGSNDATCVILNDDVPHSISGRCVSIRADGTYSATNRAGVSAAITVLNSTGGTVATVNTDSNGNFVVPNIPAGDYTLTSTAQREGQADVVMDPPVRSVSVTTEDVAVPRFALYSIFGIVKQPKNGANVPLAGATVTLVNPKGVEIATRVTGADGKYEFRNQRAATFTLRTSAPGFSFPAKTVTLMSTGQTWSPCARAHIVGVPTAGKVKGSARTF